MWLFTTVGFFSVVQKPGEDVLTVRARVAADLDRLREAYLPALSPTVAGGGSDYPYRATVGHADFGRGLARLAADLHYPNFKDAVAAAQDRDREAVYNRVWHELRALNPPLAPARTGAQGMRGTGRARAYGGVVIDDAGRVLLREPHGHYGGYRWTFPKGRPLPTEASPSETARREVREETGVVATVVEALPGAFAGTTTETHYFLLAPEGTAGAWDDETQAIRWADREEAARLIAMTPHAKGRERDLRVLALAFGRYDALRRGESRIAARHDWRTEPLPRQRATLTIGRAVSADEITRIRRGLVPEEMEQKWFLFYEGDRLYCHRSWTGYCIYVAHFARRGDTSLLTHAEVNRDPEQYTETDDRHDAQILNYLLDSLLLGAAAEWPVRDEDPPPDRPARAAERRGTAPAGTPFYVQSRMQGEAEVEAWSVARLPYVPKGWLGDFRQHLRAAVATLSAEPGQVLHAVYVSPDISTVDAENVLFYNVDPGRFAAAARHGIRFERAVAVPPPCPRQLVATPEHYHRYWLAPAAAPFRYWVASEPLLRWRGELPDAAAVKRCGSVWHALKRRAPEVLSPPPALPRFGLRVTLTMPPHSTVRAVDAIKPLLDGAVAALHRHDGTAEAEVSRRLAVELGAAPAEVAGLLRADAGAVLGERRVVHLWGKAVQWNPADDRCYANELRVQPGSAPTGFAIDVEVFAITPVSGAA